MITIIDYEAGNLTSVKRALDSIGVESRISSDPKDITESDRIIFPGVGHAKSAMESIQKRKLDKALRTALSKNIPIMGICLGTQIILSHSQEGDVDTLGLIDGETLRFNLNDKSLSVPHMGWNSVNVTKPHYILKDLQPGDELYFVHSYYPKPTDPIAVYATTEYEITFACAIGAGSLFATQFHPEKSGPIGLQILKNFSTWDGKDA